MSALDNASAAVQLVQGIADKAGISVDAASMLRLAGELLQSATELLDGHAKKHAEAAGAAAAAAITTEPEAEAAQRKP